MTPAPVTYSFDQNSTARQALEAVGERLSHRREGRRSHSTTYYDTFDWRLYRKRGLLSSLSDGHARVLQWHRIDSTLLHRIPLSSKPGFVWDLPAGSLRDELEPIIEMRRLLPVVTVDAEIEAISILDGRRKTVARLHLVDSTAHPRQGSGPSAKLPARLLLIPVRGYEQPPAEVRAILDESGLAPSETSEFQMAIGALELKPETYSRKLDLSLDPTMRSDDAVKVILRRLLEVMEHNEAGLLDNLDSEFLHDFRVAVRRTRSALTQLKGVFPVEKVAHFKVEFSWLGQITGPTRDLDVYQLKMPEYRASLPEELRSDLDPLEEFLERHHRLEHSNLTQLLDSSRYDRLLADWKAFLNSSVDEQADAPAAATPILELASRRIWRSARRVLKKGGAIEPDSPAESLHRLRIDCKKLRYLLEFFRSLFPARELDPLIDALKSLQDNLGDFNDLEVQQATLRDYAQTMMAEKLGTASSLLAMGRLVERLEQRQVVERQAFHQRFDAFSSRKNRRRLKDLFETPGRAGA